MRRKIKFLQFYIGNSCNLACPGCASYNNFNFKGQFKWKDNKESARKWAEILDPYEVAIIGGEPFSNYDLENWVYGLLDFFSCEDFRITTNGTYLERHIAKVKEFTSAGVNIEISSHSDEHYETHNNFIEKYFPYKEVLEDAIVYRNQNKGFIEIRKATEFFNNSIEKFDNGVFYMHDNDADVAHKNCLVKDCHYIVEGKLYQCVVTATSTMFAEQFEIDRISLEKIKKTKYVTTKDKIEDIQEFINNIDKPCEQCSLCPSEIRVNKFVLPIKKEKL